MKKFLLTLSSLAFFSFTPIANAELLLFVREGCIHCDQLEYDLEVKNAYAEKQIKEIDILEKEENMQNYLETAKELGYTSGGVPLLVDGDVFVEGRSSILEYLGYHNNAAESPVSSSISPEDSDLLNDFIKEEQKAKKPNHLVFWGVTIPTFMIVGFYFYRRLK